MTDTKSTVVDRFLAMIEKNQDNALVRLSLGNAYLAEKLYPEAIDHLQQAVAHDQNYSAAWLNLAKAYQQANDYQNAIECYEKTLAIAEEKGDMQIVRQAEVLLQKAHKTLANQQKLAAADSAETAN